MFKSKSIKKDGAKYGKNHIYGNNSHFHNPATLISDWMRSSLERIKENGICVDIKHNNDVVSILSPDEIIIFKVKRGLEKITKGTYFLSERRYYLGQLYNKKYRKCKITRERLFKDLKIKGIIK